MSGFGVLLKKHRHHSRDLKSGRPLTQERLAELLSLKARVEGYSGSTVSNWERGVNQIRRDDRHILVALIAVLHQAGGIQTQEQANQILLAGNYRSLDKEELIQIDSNWSYPHTNRLSDVPFSAEQEALLPAPSYSRLFGVETLIQDVVAQLKSQHTSRLIVLTGIGGMGKTAVADAVARRAIQQHLFAHVIWVTAAADKINVPAGSVFQSIVNTLCRQLLPEDNHESNPVKQLVRLRFKLNRYPHLVVIDNLEESDEASLALKQLQGIIGSGKCLVTARHHPPVEIEATTISIPELSFKDATDLLNYQTEVTGGLALQQVTEADIEDLYAIVGGHPFALRLIPRLARMYPLSEILLSWQNEQPGYIANVYKSVYDELWLTLLPTEKHLMSIMPLVSQTGGTLDYLQVICNLPRETVWPILTKLMECCLIEPHGNMYEQRYRIHRLTEQYVLNRNQSEFEDFPIPVEVIQRGLVYWQQFYDQLSDKEWVKLDREQENIFKALQYSLILSEETVTPSMQTAWQNLFDYLFRYIEQRGYAAKWLPLLEEITEKVSNNSSIHLHLLNRLGEVYRLNHQLREAIELHQRVLRLALQAEDAVEIAQAHLNLGNDYFQNRQYEIAVKHGSLSLNQLDQLSLSGRERAASLNLVGMSVFMLGEWKRSSHHLRDAVAIWRDLNSQPELARTLRNLAMALQAQQDIDGVEKCYAEAKRVLTKTASELDRTLIYLAEGTFHFEQKQYRKAEAVFKRIDLAYLRKSGHIYYLAYTLNNLGNVAFVCERYMDAEQLLRESIQYWQHLAEPLEMANSLGRLGDVLIIQDKREEARLTFAKAAQLLEQNDSDSRMVHLREELTEALAQIEDAKKEG